LFAAGVCDPGTGLIETGYSLQTGLPQSAMRGLFHGMSTLQEIEAAVQVLPRVEQEILYAHLGARLEGKNVPSAMRGENPRLAAFEALQKRLALETDRVREWQQAVYAARR
jgi:hypothetical protein